MSTVGLERIGGLFLLLVPGCAAAGHVLAGALAWLLRKDEEGWERRGEYIFGIVGIGGWIGCTLAILNS